MVIRKSEDVVELLSERIEAMEDLNCEDLEVCVRSFMVLHAICMSMENAKELAQHEAKRSQVWVNARETFKQGRALAVTPMKIIDELTLRNDAAE